MSCYCMYCASTKEKKEMEDVYHFEAEGYCKSCWKTEETKKQILEDLGVHNEI